MCILYLRGDNLRNMEKINAVDRMQTYIENHITESITPFMVASSAGYSPWHCTRIFNELTGKTPFEYIRALRLSRADEDAPRFQLAPMGYRGYIEARPVKQLNIK